MLIGQGYTNCFLTPAAMKQIVGEGLASLPVDGKRVLVIIPDGTRTMPMPQMFTLFQELLLPRLKKLDFLVALGTHQPMDDCQLSNLVGQPVVDGKVGEVQIYNHHWEYQGNFTRIGTIPAAEIYDLTGGLFAQEVPVVLNRLILDYDHLLICGPVFPHEVVGFSGGNKYFFPGIAGPDIINFTHWLGAVMTNRKIIGAGYTPVRAVIDRAASFIDRPRSCFTLVVTHEGIAGLYFGSPEEAWRAAAELSAKKHIIYVDKPFQRVLSIMPEMYDDLWTAAKGMYKMEPAIADGGEVIIYAPHILEVSYTHGKILDEIGYHTCDYFLKQWELFKHYPGGVLAHSTHVKGTGEYNLLTGIETPRIRVTLATSISEERCRRINLGYLDPLAIRIEDWQNQATDGVLVNPRAGEMLYKLKK